MAQRIRQFENRSRPRSGSLGGTLEDIFKRKREQEDLCEDGFQKSKITVRSPPLKRTNSLSVDLSLPIEEMEALMSRLDSMEKNLSSEIQDVKKGNEDLKKKFEEIKVSLQEDKEDIRKLKESVDVLTKENTRMRERMDASENQMRRSNLLFYHIQEIEEENWKDCESAVIQLVKQVMNINLSHDEIERAHRLGKSNENGDPRPIIVKFLHYKKKDEIISNSYRLKGRKESISEDYSHGVRMIRKELGQYLTALKNEGHNVKIRYNQLIVDGVKYSLAQVKKKWPRSPAKHASQA